MSALLRALRSLVLVATLWGCGEQSLVPLPGDDPQPGQPDAVDTGTTPPDPAEEICDGLDNDNDGFIDEGFVDTDGDGHADCVDEACEVTSVDGGVVAEADTCVVDTAPPVDPWDVELLWEFDGTAGAQWGCRVNAVADLDGDGVAEILCGSEQLYVLNGVTGEVEWTSSAFGMMSPTAVADLDRDGVIDIVGLGEDGSIVALAGDSGEEMWRTDEAVGWSLGLRFETQVRTYIAVADLDADGTPEVITDQAIVSGADGSFWVWLFGAEPELLDYGFLDIAVGDVDRGGVPDIAFQGWVFDADGSAVWTADTWSEGDVMSPSVVIPAFIQADDDAEAEVLWLTDRAIELDEADGTVVGVFATPNPDDNANNSIQCVADLDGDGLSDVVWSDPELVHAWSAHGEELWSMPVVDNSSGGACSTFDFDGDGGVEVLLADEEHLWIWDGRTGVVRYSDPELRSETICDPPVVVDLDGDGSVEILAPHSWGYTFGPPLRVYGNANRDWPAGARIWGSSTWSGTSLQADGTVPRTADAPWLTTGIWRGQVSSLPDGADVRVDVVDECVSSCEAADAEARLSVRLENLGPAELGTDTALSLYYLDEVGERSLVQVWRYTELADADFFDNGTATGSVEVVMTTAQARRGVVLVAGDDGSGEVVVDDCNLDNNTLTWRTTACD